jgi:hypothetical protein
MAMAASRQCEECLHVKRCSLYVRATYCLDPTKWPEKHNNFHEERAYLCRPCARSLGYSPRPRGTKSR